MTTARSAHRLACDILLALFLLGATGCSKSAPAPALDAATGDAAKEDRDAGADGSVDRVDGATDASATDASDGGPRIDPRFSDLAAAVRADIETNNATAASVALWLDGEIVWVGGFGTADPDGNTPPDENTVFMIGSDTKKLTSILYLQDVAAGRATTATTIAEVLPDLHLAHAPDLLSATGHQLMTHQGGMLEDSGEVPSTTTTDDVLRSHTFGTYAAEAVQLSKPGLFFNYGNTNITMVGLMSETLNSTPFADLIKSRVLDPLEMTRTFARKSEVDDNYAPGFGYSQDGSGRVKRVPIEQTWENGFGRPAATFWSTPTDQMRVARFLVEGDADVLPAELVEQMHTAQVRSYADISRHYGYGLFIQPGMNVDGSYYAMPHWFHGGTTGTHTAAFHILPEQRFAISILSNGYGDDFSRSVEVAIRSLVELPAATARPALPPRDATILQSFVGSYNEPNFFGRIVLTRSGTTMSIDMPDLDVRGIAYESNVSVYTNRYWIVTIQGAPYEINVYDVDGATYLVNRSFVAVRAPAGPTKSPPM